MKIAIVEDEASDRELLLDCLAMYTDDTKAAVSISTFDCAAAFLGDGIAGRYDLIFLDIYLGDANGMDVAQKLRNAHIKSQLVFVTTSALHAVASYAVSAAYYLLKPYTYTQFTAMMKAVLARRAVDEATIAIKSGRDVESIPLSSILYVDYADHSVYIHTSTRDIRSYVKFRETAERFERYPQFFKCYHNVLINMDKVEKLEGDHFVLQYGHCVPITRNRLRATREAYSTYIFSTMKEPEVP